MSTLAAAALIARVLIAFVLGRAALHKLRAPAHFVGQVRAYRLLPAALTTPIAFALMIAEAVVATAVLNPSWRLPGAIAAALFCVYAVAMAINLQRGRTALDCGCGGPLAARTAIDWRLVARNGALAAIASMIAAVEVPSIDAALWLIVLPASAAALLIYASTEQAIVNHQRVLAWKR
jgi:uncharacterized membrane protein YphA (DoxX/SURF4 family)